MHQKHLFLGLLGAMVILGLTPNRSHACRSMTMQQRSPIASAPWLEQKDAGSTRLIKPTIKRSYNLSKWRGKYTLVESKSSNPAPVSRRYRIRISLARCGWRAFISVQGHRIGIDLQSNVVAQDQNTIGLYYQQTQMPFLRRTPFKPGDRLLRIQRIPAQTNQTSQQPTYRVYFDKLRPLVPDSAKQGIDIAAPKKL